MSEESIEVAPSAPRPGFVRFLAHPATVLGVAFVLNALAGVGLGAAFKFLGLFDAANARGETTVLLVHEIVRALAAVVTALFVARFLERRAPVEYGARRLGPELGGGLRLRSPAPLARGRPVRGLRLVPGRRPPVRRGRDHRAASCSACSSASSRRCSSGASSSGWSSAGSARTSRSRSAAGCSGSSTSATRTRPGSRAWRSRSRPGCCSASSTCSPGRSGRRSACTGPGTSSRAPSSAPRSRGSRSTRCSSR